MAKNAVAPSEKGLPFGPSTRYQGSKRKLQLWLLSRLERLSFRSIVDVMSGTSSLGYAMKRAGKIVTANDYLRFNYKTAVALIENSGVHVTADEVSWLLTRHQGLTYRSFIEETFDGMYFTRAENRWLDQTAANIFALSARAGDERTGEYKGALAWHAVVQAALAKRPFNLFHRKNLYLRLAVVPRKFGNKTTWETPFAELFKRFINEANRCVFDNGASNRALNRDASSLEVPCADLVYIDPPYFARQRERARSNYRLLYHFVEGLVQYESWPYMIDFRHPLRALKPIDESSDNLFSCPASEVDDRYTSWLEGILQLWPNAQVAISYKHPGMPSINSLRKLIMETGRSVQIEAAKYTYALSKKNGKPKENIEVLLIGS